MYSLILLGRVVTCESMMRVSDVCVGLSVGVWAACVPRCAPDASDCTSGHLGVKSAPDLMSLCFCVAYLRRIVLHGVVDLPSRHLSEKARGHPVTEGSERDILGSARS